MQSLFHVPQLKVVVHLAINVPHLKVSVHLAINVSDPKTTIYVKFPPFKIFLSLIFKLAAPPLPQLKTFKGDWPGGGGARMYTQI
jgi:hypothetical protein